MEYRRVETIHLQNGLMVGPSPPGGCEDDFLALVLNHCLSHELLSQAGDEFFGESDQILIVRVGHVEFQHRKFRIVNRRDAFIPKVAVDLEDPWKSSDDQAL